jgi:sugar lactone lactonase YvrE
VKLNFTPLPLPRQQLGESPFWHAAEKRLYWCDILAQKVQAFDPHTQQHSVWEFDTEPGCIAPASRHRIVVALRGEVQLLNTQTGKRETIAVIPHDTTQQRSNDGRCDAHGRLWIGTVFAPKTAEAAALWRLQVREQEGREGHDGRERGYEIQHMLSENMTANGLAFSPDSTQMYWAHTAAHRIDRMDFNVIEGTVQHRRPWQQFTDKASQPYGGRPDGAAVDAEGCYWSAMYEGGVLLRISPQGEVVARYALPTRYPTMPCLGGDDLRTLYLTSASAASSALDAQADGLIFSARVAVPGLPAAQFRCLDDDH